MNKYLVIQAARFGDLLQTKRLILSLQKFGIVYILIDKSLVELAKKIYPGVEVLGINFHKRPKLDGLQKDLHIFSLLKNISFSKIFNCNYSPLTTTICRLFAVDRIVGYRPAYCMKEAILKSAWARLAFRLVLNRRQSPLNLVDFWGWFFGEPLPAEKINENAQGKGGGLGIAISGREERRSLPANVLAQIINTVFHLLDLKAIKLFGTIHEEKKAKKLIHLLSPVLQEKVIDYTGKTSLLELNEEVAGLDLLITPDTGIMHLAAVHGIPILAFFLSSANCHETGPYGKGHYIFQSVASCSPCIETNKCGMSHECLKPFKNPDFIKYISKISFYKQTDVHIDGMQCWTPNFDNFGQTLELVNGFDNYYAIRKQLEKIIKNFFGLQCPENTNYVSRVEAEKLLESCYPNQEWMFPIHRYI